MDDKQILDLYINRSEKAIEETDAKYGSYCRKISMNILQNIQDSEETVNDTWLKGMEYQYLPKCESVKNIFG